MGSKEKSIVQPLKSPDFSKVESGKIQTLTRTSTHDNKSFLPLFSNSGNKGTGSYRSQEQQKRDASIKQAEQIIQEAHRKADEIAEKAYEKGYAEGEKAGYEYGMKKVEGMIQALAETQKQLKDVHKNIIRSQEKEIISLVLSIAKKVIHTETRTNPDVLLSVLRKALGEVPHKEDLHIRLSPMDYEFYKKNVQKFVETQEELKEAVIEPDSRVDLGGVVVDHKMGSVDARLSRQYEKIETLFRKILDENLKDKNTSFRG